MRRGFLGHVTREDWGHTLGTPGRRMDNLDALGYLKCSIAHTGYLAILLVLHILQYVQYSHMGSIARTGYSIADTGTSTLEHTSRHPHVLGNNFVPYVFQKLRLAQIRM